MMPLALVQNTLASIIRADGSPKYSMAAMMAGAVINMIGDPVAIFVLGWGIKGAAFATILGQFVSFLICAAYLRKSRVFRVKATNHAWLLVYREEQAVLLQKKDLIKGDVEKFRPYLQENITK